MEKSRKSNWSKEEEYTPIDAIQSAGKLLRGTGHCADLNKKKRLMWIDMIGKVNSIHGHTKDVKDLKKKWNNLKGAAKSHVDSSRREARQIGGGPNVVGEIDDEAILILAADKDLSTTATERITEMLEGTPAFSGIKRSANLFEGPSNSLPEELVIESSSMIIDAPKVLVNNSSTVGICPRKLKRSAEKSSVRSLSASDLLPLQQEVLCKQMEVFSAQLAFVEEQREYYRLKKQKLLENKNE